MDTQGKKLTKEEKEARKAEREREALAQFAQHATALGPSCEASVEGTPDRLDRAKFLEAAAPELRGNHRGLTLIPRQASRGSFHLVQC